jgi:hypothetical protein
MRILQRNLKHTTDTFLFISHTTNVLLFKFRCNIFIGVRIIKEMPGSVASGTLYIRKPKIERESEHIKCIQNLCVAGIMSNLRTHMFSLIIKEKYS